jgi:hypothetical protein
MGGYAAIELVRMQQRRAEREQREEAERKAERDAALNRLGLADEQRKP